MNCLCCNNIYHPCSRWRCLHYLYNTFSALFKTFPTQTTNAPAKRAVITTITSHRTGALALPYFIHCHCRIGSIYAPAPKWYGAYVRKDILPISYMVKYRTMLNAVFKQCLGHHILRRSKIIYGIIHSIFINLTWVILDSLLR